MAESIQYRRRLIADELVAGPALLFVQSDGHSFFGKNVP